MTERNSIRTSEIFFDDIRRRLGLRKAQLFDTHPYNPRWSALEDYDFLSMTPPARMGGRPTILFSNPPFEDGILSAHLARAEVLHAAGWSLILLLPRKAITEPYLVKWAVEGRLMLC